MAFVKYLILTCIIATSLSWPISDDSEETLAGYAKLKVREKITGTVTSVHDGDTFRFLPVDSTDGKTLKVRLIGIDAPEVERPGLQAEPFAIESRDRLKQLILGKKFKMTVFAKDRFDRFLGTVVVNGEHVSLTLVKEGLAIVYRKSGAEYGDIRQALNNAEMKAKKNKVGLWNV